MTPRSSNVAMYVDNSKPGRDSCLDSRATLDLKRLHRCWRSS